MKLLSASTDAAAALEQRRELIGRIRFDSAEAGLAAQRVADRVPVAPVASVTPAITAATVASTAPATPPRRAFQPATPTPAAAASPAPAPAPAPAPQVATATAPVPQVATAPAPALTPPRPPATAHPPAPASIPAVPRRSSVKVLLLVGVTLVSVAAIFFLTVAWIFDGLAVPSAIIALFTVAALVTAGILKRRRLVATAEGIGVLAVVLVLLDAWALRENDLFGLAAADGPAYWGVSLTACTALFLGWHAVYGLRGASVAGFAVAAPGLGLLAAGLAAGPPDATRLYLGFLGAAVGAPLHRFTLFRPAAAPAAPDAPAASAAPTTGTRPRYWPSVDRAPERQALLKLAAPAPADDSTPAPFVDEAVVLARL